MVLSLEDYQIMTATQKKIVKRAEFQALSDEFVGDDANIASLRGIIRDELNTEQNIEDALQERI